MPPRSYPPQPGQSPQGGHSPLHGEPPRPGQPYAGQQPQFDAGNGQLPQPAAYGHPPNPLQSPPAAQSTYLGQMAVPQQRPHLTHLPGNNQAYPGFHNGQPSQPDVVPPPPPRPETPYDFFMNNQPTKKSGLFSGGKPSKLVMIAAGGVCLVLILGVVAIMSPRTVPKLEMIAVAQAQNETLRVCRQATDDAKQQPIRSFVINCNLSLASGQRTLLAVLTQGGISVGADTLAAGQNAKYDTQLASARSASNFDEVFPTVAEAQLNVYAQTIQQAAISANTTTLEKEVLAQQYESSQLLLQQLKASDE